MDPRALRPDQIISVYSGRAGKCMCGCSGKHRYAKAHRERAGAARGYAIGDAEINDAQITRVLRLIQSAPEIEIADDGAWISARIGERDYVAYLLDAARPLIPADEAAVDVARLGDALEGIG